MTATQSEEVARLHKTGGITLLGGIAAANNTELMI